MPDLRLLLLVNVTIAPEHLEEFTLYYNDHIPASLTIPGYLWGQRYVSLSDPARFLALYQVRSPEDLETMLDWKSPRLHPTARSEFAMWQRLPGMSNSITNVYEQIMGTPLDEPLLRSDRPISMVMADVDPAHEEEWNRWYTDSRVPNLLKIPGYAMAGRFRTLGHPVTNNFNSGPRYLALYECESDEVIPSLAYGAQMRHQAQEEFQNWKRIGEPHTRNFSWGFYKMISKHFKWQET